MTAQGAGTVAMLAAGAAQWPCLLQGPPPGRCGQASASTAAGTGFAPLSLIITPVTSAFVIQWLPCQAPGAKGVSARTGRTGVRMLELK